MKIIIKGEPVPQARARLYKRWGKHGVYDPNAKDKEIIREFLKCKADLHSQQFNYPSISFLFHMPIPKNLSKRVMSIYESGLLKHTKKPDVDNLVKLYLDCLDGIIIHKDQKVSLGSCVKVYHPEPKTIIWISEGSCFLDKRDLDVEFLDDLEFSKQISYELDFPCGS